MNEARKKFLPEFDLHAKKPHKIYDAKKIAGEAAWAQISREVDACLHKDDWVLALAGEENPKSFNGNSMRPKWPKTLREVVKGMENDVIDEERRYRLRALTLLRHMVRFHDMITRPFHAGTSDDLSKIMNVPKEVASRLFDLFAEPMGRNGRPGFVWNKQHKDSRHVHMLILFMMGHGKEMVLSSINEFASELQSMDVFTASMYLTQAGCTTKKGTDGSLSATLRVPLTFPAPPRKRGGAKR
jgi:hypothetical protein